MGDKSVELRPYQREAIELLMSQTKAVVTILPMGCGMTVLPGQVVVVDESHRRRKPRGRKGSR